MDLEEMAKEGSNLSLVIDTIDMINFLTRLGITISTDIQIWLSGHNRLYFFSVSQALLTVRALVADDKELVFLIYKMCMLYTELPRNWDKKKWQSIKSRVLNYFNYIKFTNIEILKCWLINNDKNIPKHLLPIRDILIKEKNNLDMFCAQQRQSSLESILIE